MSRRPRQLLHDRYIGALVWQSQGTLQLPSPLETVTTKWSFRRIIQDSLQCRLVSEAKDET